MSITGQETSGAQRITLDTPDGGTIYLDRSAQPEIPDRPYHLTGCGVNFATVGEARDWITTNWDKPDAPYDRSYEIAEATFGEEP